MDKMDYLEDAKGYEDEEYEDYDGDEIEFDAKKYVNAFLEENTDEDEALNLSEVQDTFGESNRGEDTLDEEQKVQILGEMFSCLPSVLIKRILMSEDVQGNLTRARKRLREFQEMERAQDNNISPPVERGGVRPKSWALPEHAWRKATKQETNVLEVEEDTVSNQPTMDGSLGSLPTGITEKHITETKPERWAYPSSEWKKPEVIQEQEDQIPAAEERAAGNGQMGVESRGSLDKQPYVIPRRRRGRNNKGKGWAMQNEQLDNDEEAEWRYNDEFDSEKPHERERSKECRGRGGGSIYRGKPRGGVRGGGVASQWNNKKASQRGWAGSGADSMDHMFFQPQVGRRKRGGGGTQWSNGRGRNDRGRGRGFQRPPSEQFHSPSNRDTRRGQGVRGGGRGIDQFVGIADQSWEDGSFAHGYRPEYQNQGYRRRTTGPMEDFHVGRSRKEELQPFGETDKGESGQGTQHDRNNPRQMRRAESRPSVFQNDDLQQSTGTQVQQDLSLFTTNKLLISGIKEITSDDTVWNFVEAMSGDEVKEVLKLGKGRALVTMTGDITNFDRMKEKGEKRGLESARVCIERAPVCRSILVSGIPSTTTKDNIELYFENPRSQGGEVESVDYTPGCGSAVVVFKDPNDMERVLARQDEKPHILAKVQVSVKRFHELLDEVVFEPTESERAPSPNTRNTQNEQKSTKETTGQQLHIAVDPDVMECVMTSSYKDELKKSLSENNCELNWKPSTKFAVVCYHGDKEADSWQTDCIDTVQSFLAKFVSCDVQASKDFWEAVVGQIASIRACLGEHPPLVKTIDSAFTLRILCLNSEGKSYEEKVKANLEEIYCREIRKTYLKKKIPNVPEEHIVLLKKVKFVETLQTKNKELTVLMDGEAEEVYFEGPQQQFIEATMKFYKLTSEMVEKKLNLSKSILEVLGTDEGMQKVRIDFEMGKVEAVFVIESEAKIVGISAAHADKALSRISGLTTEEKVRVDENSVDLLKTVEWLELCEELNRNQSVSIHRNSWNDTWIAGFRSDVKECMGLLRKFLAENCRQEEEFLCPSRLVRRYLTEFHQRDLRSLEDELKRFEVKVQDGKSEDTIIITGKKGGLGPGKERLQALIAGSESRKFAIEQPGLRKYFASGIADQLVKSVEKDNKCVIQVDVNFRPERGNVKPLRSATAATDDEDSTTSDDNDDFPDGGAFPINANAWVSTHGHKISWNAGDIADVKLRVHTLVSPKGICAQVIAKAAKSAGFPIQIGSPNIGDIAVSPGFPPTCSQVILTECCPWNNGTGDATLRAIVQKCLQKVDGLGGDSVAFPVIGTGNLHFPPNVACKIMIEESITYCQTHQSSSVKDIRFVVNQQDQNLIAAIQQEMQSAQSRYKSQTLPRSVGLLRALFPRRRLGSHHLGTDLVKVVPGDLTKESRDAIISMNGKDMVLANAGQSSQIVGKVGGSQLLEECRKLAPQSGGTPVMTSGGYLPSRHVIHLIPENNFPSKQHLQRCLEKCFEVAEAQGLKSIALPAVGTGNIGMSAQDSADLTFQALSNTVGTFHNIRKVRVVILKSKPDMLQTFQDELLRCTFPDRDVKVQSSTKTSDANSNNSKRLTSRAATTKSSVTISVTGRNKADTDKAVDAIKKGFSGACTTQTVESEVISKLSDRQIGVLQKEAEEGDVHLEITTDKNHIDVRGAPTDVSGMVGKIWKEINERTTKDRDREQAKLISKNVEWRYEIHGNTMPFDLKTNAKIEVAHTKNMPTVKVTLIGDEFVINLTNNIGVGQQTKQQITVQRKVKGGEEGIPLPRNWTPMPPGHVTVHKVQLQPGSSEYQDVVRQVRATAAAVNIQKIERIQNPHLYQSYMVRKQTMDKTNGGNNELPLFHGTDGKNIAAINTQGFNRSFCGIHGTAYGRGVYFARDASYSVRYAGSGVGGRFMYLAKVLVGQYCVGNSSMIIPPPKNPSRTEILYDSVVNNTQNPGIYVVFFDNQCYPEYLITFQ